MIKKIFTLSSITFLLFCNTLNTLEFKIKNKSKKPIFFRFFEKKNGVLTPPLNNFTLLTLDKGQEKNYTFEGQLCLGISMIDPANNKIKISFLKFTPGKNIDLWVDNNTDLFSKTSGPLKEGYVNSNDFINIPIVIQKNEKGKWKLSDEYLPNKPQTKFIIQKPTIIEYEQPLPQTIKVTE